MIPQVIAQYAADNFDWIALVDLNLLFLSLDHIYQNVNLVFLPIDFRNTKISICYPLFKRTMFVMVHHGDLLYHIPVQTHPSCVQSSTCLYREMQALRSLCFRNRVLEPDTGCFHSCPTDPCYSDSSAGNVPKGANRVYFSFRRLVGSMFTFQCEATRKLSG